MAVFKGTVQIDGTALGCGLTVKGKREGDASKSWPTVPDWVCELLRGNAGCAIQVTTSDGPDPPADTITAVKVG